MTILHRLEGLVKVSDDSHVIDIRITVIFIAIFNVVFIIIFIVNFIIIFIIISVLLIAVVDVVVVISIIRVIVCRCMFDNSTFFIYNIYLTTMVICSSVFGCVAAV